MIRPKVQDLAAYCADLVVLLREHEAAELRAELGQAVEELKEEIKAAQRKRAA